MGSTPLFGLRKFVGHEAAPPVVAKPRRTQGAIPTEALIREFEESGQGWFYATDSELALTYVSGEIAHKLGRDPERLLGAPLLSLFNMGASDEIAAADRPLSLLLSGRKSFSKQVVRADTRDVEIVWALSGRPHFDEAGAFEGYFGSAFDITAPRRDHLAAIRLASFDALTGLSNRQRITQQLSTTLTAFKVSNRACATLLIDLDRFKQVNDTLGHLIGDKLLKQVARRLERIVDKSWELGRLGGDEFQIILPDIDDREVLADLARKIIALLAEPFAIDGSRCVVGASVGIALCAHRRQHGRRPDSPRGPGALCGQGHGRCATALFHRRLAGQLRSPPPARRKASGGRGA